MGRSTTNSNWYAGWSIASRTLPEASAVHYITFTLDEAARTALAAGDVRIAIDHPAYQYEFGLGSNTLDELIADTAA